MSLAPAASVPKLQATVLLVDAPGLNVQAPPVAELTVNGVLLTIASFKDTLCASEGPRLLTVISQNPLVPAGAGTSGLHTFVTCKSAETKTVVDTDELLSLVSVSN